MGHKTLTLTFHIQKLFGFMFGKYYYRFDQVLAYDSMLERLEKSMNTCKNVSLLTIDDKDKEN